MQRYANHGAVHKLHLYVTAISIEIPLVHNLHLSDLPWAMGEVCDVSEAERVTV